MRYNNYATGFPVVGKEGSPRFGRQGAIFYFAHQPWLARQHREFAQPGPCIAGIVRECTQSR